MNHNGFIKLKEINSMKMDKTVGGRKIFGLESNDPDFQVLLGENQLLYPENKSFTLEHNLNYHYVQKQTQRKRMAIDSAEEKAFKKFFLKPQVSVVITNYRLLFILKPQDMDQGKMFGAQPKFIKGFFNVPLGLIAQLERFPNLSGDNKSRSQAASGN
mmetsp:Transcript_41458/g.63256  ORF Transcript_41458/g.63256 Transcript_41458/m.63256 type:complete len:158 (-) Transcript_41458:858-1331(-)